jgi:dipeptidyl aminopeptidase/acylaminoacyl peptidase
MRLFALLALLCGSLWAQKASFDVEALLKIARIADPQISPDGRTVAFVVQTPDVEKNTRPKQIWTVSIDGSRPRPITTIGNNDRPRWSFDSKQIAFESDRGGSSQIWLMNADGSEARQVTRLSTEASGVLFFPDGKSLLFVSEVYPDCPDEACNKTRVEAEKNSKVKARIYTTLLYRHWTEWQTARRRHLFVVPVEGGEPKDVTPAARQHVPPFSLGGPDGYAIAPDSKEICYVMNPDNDQATTTNSDIFVVPAGGGESRKITLNTAADTSPVYSPDGKYLAYRAQFRAGYESDRWRLMVVDRATGKASNVTEGLDRPVESMSWSPDSTRLFFTIEDRGRQTIHMVAATGGAARTIATGASVLGDVQFTPDGRTMIYTQQSGSSPVEIYRVSSSGGSATALTHINDALLAQYELTPLEEIWTEGAEKARVQSFTLKPPGFDASKKYPVLFLIHGGPQGAWQESWTYRWNPQVFASAGYFVVMPNPRGSTGFGQQFTDEINSDWGGKVYDDIMAVVDQVAALPYVDPDRLAAAGGSYGGYMANWILGHSQRFKALVSHAGVFDLRSMAGETEELWFPLWEFRGMPWDNPEVYQRWSPSHYIQDFKTPTLVIHGELDYRVPLGQGLQLFTALQMQKVPSKLLLFPDEGHWILKPQNSRLWYQSFIEWIGEWTKKPAQTAGTTPD